MKMHIRMTAVAMAICLLLLYIPAASALSYDVGVGIVTETSQTQLAVSARLTQNTLQHNTAGIQSERYIEWQNGSQLTPIVAGSDKLYGGTQTLDVIAAQLAAKGREVAAGINGDFFLVSSGIPQGIMVTGGILRTSDSSVYAVGFVNNGGVVIGRPGMSVTLSYSGQNYKIDQINKPRGTSSLTLYTPDYATDTKTDTHGTHVILDVYDTLRLNSTISGTVRSVVVGAAPAALSPGQMCLSVNTEGPVDRVSALSIGTVVTISVTVNDTRFINCSNIVGAYQPLLEDGVIPAGLETTRAPRTAIGVRSDGSAVFYTVDGRQTGYSVGLGLGELAERMRTLGCVTAVNMDGGGSTNISARYPGDTALTQLGKPSDGTPRKCGNYIFFVNDSPHTGVISEIFVKPSPLMALLGSDLDLTDSLAVTAMDTNYHSVDAPGEIVWTSTNPYIGSVAGNIFTGLLPGTTTLTAYAPGTSLSASVDVTIVDTPDSIRIVEESTGKEITELNLSPGESTTLRAIGVYGGKDMSTKNTLFTWQMTGGSAAFVTPEGVVTAGMQHGATCYLVVALGNMTQTIPVVVGKPASVLADFETAASSPFSVAQLGTGFKRDAARDTVKYGRFSGSFLYDFGLAEAGVSSVVYQADIPLSNQPSFINFWLKGDGSGNMINLLLTDTSGQSTEVTAADLNSSEYRYCSVPIPNNIARIDGIRLIQSVRGSAAGSFNIDQITAAFDSLQDLSAPQVSFSLQGSIGEGSLTVQGTVLDVGGSVLQKSNIRVLWDGKEIPFTYEQVGGKFSATVTIPIEGFHRITVEARDSSGNYEIVSKNFTQPTTLTLASYTDIASHWALPQIEFLDRKGVFSTGDIGVRVFRPDDTITRAEVAVLMSRVLGLNEDEWSNVLLPYADVDLIPQYALGAAKALYGVGIMRGASINNVLQFNPNGTFTRAEAFTLIANAFPVGMSKPQVPFTFTDSADIPSYASSAVSLLMTLEIIQGDSQNRIVPEDTITRSMLAKLLCSLY